MTILVLLCEKGVICVYILNEQFAMLLFKYHLKKRISTL